MIHDVCIRGHMVFAVDRAGLVGADGDTHRAFDLSYLSLIPNMVCA